MSVYYPQGSMILTIVWEDFGKPDAFLQAKYTLPTLARHLTVELNDYSEADTFRAEIDYKSFPFDPRCIRACGVSIQIADQKSIFRGSGNELKLLEPSEENTVFVGFADEDNILLDDETSTVRLEGRDFTSLFLDAKYLGGQISMSLPLDQILEQLVKAQKATETIKIINRVGETLPTLSQLAPDFNSTTGVRNPKRKESYWDVMQDLAARAGVIIYIELDKLVINKPQNLYSPDTPLKQFIYGKNVRSLEYKRKLGRQRGFNLKVVSLNVEKKELIEAKIPLENVNLGLPQIENTILQLDKEGNPIDPPKAADYLTFRVADIGSKDHLIVVAEKIYVELSRQELEGKLSTWDMEIPEQVTKDRGATEPVSFNTIRNATPIAIIMDRDDLEKIKTISTIAQRKQYLIVRGYSNDVANAFAQSMNRINTRFYTKAVRFTLDQANGFEMELDFVNFIELDNANLRL